MTSFKPTTTPRAQPSSTRVPSLFFFFFFFFFFWLFTAFYFDFFDIARLAVAKGWVHPSSAQPVISKLMDSRPHWRVIQVRALLAYVVYPEKFFSRKG